MPLAGSGSVPTALRHSAFMKTSEQSEGLCGERCRLIVRLFDKRTHATVSAARLLAQQTGEGVLRSLISVELHPVRCDLHQAQSDIAPSAARCVVHIHGHIHCICAPRWLAVWNPLPQYNPRDTEMAFPAQGAVSPIKGAVYAPFPTTPARKVAPRRQSALCATFLHPIKKPRRFPFPRTGVETDAAMAPGQVVGQTGSR